MCGIAGRFSKTKNNHSEKSLFNKMIRCLEHRGPDDYGIYLDDHVGLAQSRLSIIDLSGGKQPIHNEDKSIWIIFNGEIFNYIELGETLAKNAINFIQKVTPKLLFMPMKSTALILLNNLMVSLLSQFGIQKSVN